MNIRSHTHIDNHIDRSETKGESCEQAIKPGLWKLLVAAVVILVGLITVMEFFGDGESDFISPHTAHTSGK